VYVETIQKLLIYFLNLSSTNFVTLVIIGGTVLLVPVVLDLTAGQRQRQTERAEKKQENN
jgi:hypothetical protein